MAKRVPKRTAIADAQQLKKGRPRRPPAAAQPEPAACPYIEEALRPLAVPIDELQPDPQNARTHDERNLEAIAGSLRQYGQRTPIVVQVVGRKRIVRKGNGTVEAARRLGWTHIAAVKVKEDDQAATGYAIADNRTAELSGWDRKLLASHLQALDQIDGFDLTDTGFTPDDLSDLISAGLDGPAEPGTDSGRSRRRSPAAEDDTAAPEEAPPPPDPQLLVRCVDESDLQQLSDLLNAEQISHRTFAGTLPEDIARAF